MSDTKILSCTCKHEFQDKRYGLKMRVHNSLGKSGRAKIVAQIRLFRCTVCKHERQE